jgi:hypothetical protein
MGRDVVWAGTVLFAVRSQFRRTTMLVFTKIATDFAVRLIKRMTKISLCRAFSGKYIAKTFFIIPKFNLENS